METPHPCSFDPPGSASGDITLVFTADDKRRHAVFESSTRANQSQPVSCTDTAGSRASWTTAVAGSQANFGDITAFALRSLASICSGGSQPDV